MNRTKRKKSFSYRDLLYKILIFIATVTIIVYFLPRDDDFGYQFDINKPWKYGQLIATFDFPIYKEEAVIRRETDSLLANFQPYFTLQPQVEKEELEKLRVNYNSYLRNIPPSTDYIRHVQRTLSEVYKSGILSTEDIQMLYEDSITSIRVIEGKESTIRMTDGIFSVKEAYEYILYADTTRYDAELLRQCALNEYITPNLIYDRPYTETARQEMLDSHSRASGVVLSGQKIIDRGEIVTRNTYNILESLREETNKRSSSATQKRIVLAGQILFVSIMVLCFMLYVELFRKDYYSKRRSLLLLFLLIIIYCVSTSLLSQHPVFNVYIIPYAMLPMIIRIFLDSRTAFMAHVITMLICSITMVYPHEFILLQVIAGLVGIFSLRELSQRSQLFRTTFFIVLSYFIVYFAYELIIESDLSKLNITIYIYFVINGALLLFTYPLLFLLEKTFGFTSNVTLVELSNINNDLLRRLSETTPGTFQHSLQVANLAAEAANRIGAKSQLVRTGALYHDIGKMENPAFFTENQMGGINPHKSLSYEQSAQVIISHVTDGLKLADKYNLPQVIKDFISTHHGTGKTKYFYISWKNEHPGEEPDDSLFTYPGPNPFTQETAILMMADAVEAASRSLPEYTEESIGNLVDKIIDSQVQEGFFKECPITFKDIATVKNVFKEKLKTIYHTRISYPELKK